MQYPMFLHKMKTMKNNFCVKKGMDGNTHVAVSIRFGVCCFSVT